MAKQPNSLFAKNLVKIFPRDWVMGNITLSVAPGLSSVDGFKLKGEMEQEFFFAPPKQEIKILNSGVIVPRTSQIPFTFESVGHDKVDVRVIRILEKKRPLLLTIQRTSWQQRPQTIW